MIGYFAYSKGVVFCDGVSCVIAGSEELMKQYIKGSDNDNTCNYTIKKTRFGEILKGLKNDGIYSFDKESYGRFLPLIRSKNIKNFIAPDFEEKASEEEIDLIQVSFN